MKRIPDASLKALNSFRIEARARQLLILETSEDLDWLASAFRFDPGRDLVLGGGSNVLLARDIDGTVILNHVTGVTIIEETAESALVEFNAGQNWHHCVRWSLEQGLSGIENLSLIPGLAGAAPIQNIGAYGVELADVLESVEVIELCSGIRLNFSREDCNFAYRDSRFKSTDAGRYLVTRIRLRLQREFMPRLDYAGVQLELNSMGIDKPNAEQVSDAVIRIRRRKLPDPQRTGNAGSFFKNPVMDHESANELKKQFRELPVHDMDNGQVKLSAAWMIDHCGWKGRALGDAAVSSKHALVLVNHGNASGADILALADHVMDSVMKRFGIRLEPEINIIR